MKAIKMIRSVWATTALATLAIGLVIVLGAQLDRATEEEIVTRFSQRQLLLAEQTAAGIQSIFDEARRDLLHIREGGGPACLADGLGAENEEEIATCLEVTGQGFSSYLRSHPNYTQIRYIDASGQEIVGTDSDGETVRPIPRDELRSQAEREFFVATQQLDAGEIYVSPLEPALGHGGVMAGRWTVRLATPVFDNQGRRQGIVVLNLLGDGIRTHVARSSAEEGTDAWLLDETGVVIVNVAHPELEGSNTYEYCRQTGDETLVALAEDMLAGGRGTGVYLWPESGDGPPVVKRLLAYAPVCLAEDHVWSVSTSVSYDTALAAHRQTHTTLLFLGGSIIAVILAGAALIARSDRRRAVAEERAHLGEALHRRGEELETLQEISLAITVQLELDELLQNIVERGCRLLDVRAGGIYLVDETSGDLELVVSYGYTRDYTGTRLAPGEGTAGKVLQSGAPLTVDDYSHWEGRSPDWEAEPLTAALGVPLKRGDQVVGILNFSEITRARSFDEHDVWLATLFANQATIAITNARLFGETQQRVAELEALQRTSLQLVSSLDLSAVLDTIVASALTLVEASDCHIYLYDEVTEAFTFGAALWEDGRREAAVQSPRPDGLTATVAREGHPIVINDAPHHPLYTTPAAQKWSLHSIAGFPLKRAGHVLGVFNIAFLKPHAFSQEELRALGLLANQAAIAIANARLYQTEQRGRDVAEALQEAARVVNASLNLDQVLPLILEQLAQVIQYDSSAVLLLSDGRFTVTAGRGFPDLEAALRLSYGADEDNLASTVMRARRPLIIEDVQSDPRWEPDPAIPHIRGWIGAPLIVQDEVIGILTVDSRQPGAYSEEDGQLVFAFADQAAAAIENARLFEAEREQRVQAEALREAGIIVSSALDLDEVLERLLEQVERIVPSDSSNVMLIENGKARIAHQRGYERPGATDEVDSLTFEVRETANLRRMVETGQPYIVPDTKADPNWVPVETTAYIRSYVGAPITVGGEVVGFFSLDKAEAEFYRQEHAERLGAFARQAAVAIENAQLYEAERRRRQEAETLREAALALTTSLDRNHVIERILIQLQQMVPYDSASVQLLRGDRLEIVGGRGFPNLPDLLGLSFPAGGDNPNSEVVRTRSPFIVADGPAVYEEFRREPHAQAGIHSWLGVPMLVGEQLVGMIALDKQEPEFYTQEHARLAEAFAAQAAIAIENARLYEQARQEIAERKRAEEALKRRATQLATVGEVGRQITSLLELDRLLDHVVNLMREAFNYRYVSIFLVDPATGELALRTGAGYELESAKPLRLRVGEEGICGWVAASGEPLLVGDVSQEPRHYPVKVLADTRSELAVPIQTKHQIIGVLDVQSVELEGFDEDDLSTLQTLADQVSVAIENAWLFEAEREQRELAEALEEAAAAVSSTLDLDQVLDRILEQVERIVIGDAFNIMLIDDDTVRVARRRGYERLGVDDQISHVAIPVAQYPSLLKMIRTGGPVIIMDTVNDPDWVPLEGQEWRRSYVAAPIQVRDLTVGFLNVNGTRPGQFSPADARQLEAFATHAATAIENAHLYRELLDHAEQLGQRVQERTAQLQAQYARLDAILRSASDGIVVTDAGGEIIQTNPVAQTWLTRTLSPEDATRLREAVRELARQARERRETVLELTGLDLELKAAPISEPGMEEAAAVVDIHDVSHLKAVDRMKSRFVSNVSHELRTPITTIKLYAALMQRRPENWKEYLDALAQEADRQARLVEDILQISRIDTGRLEMEPRPTQLNELTEKSIVSHQVLAQEQGLTLEHRPVEPEPTVLVDPARMTQVLSNLVGNAIRYTPEGGKVVVSTGQEETEGRVWATVTVADTGMGIPEQELPHIFERFFRGEEPQTMQISGTGLGLAIAREIVELHGGRMTVASQVDVGATFTVWLPLAEGQT